MSLNSMRLLNFTAFSDLYVEFSPGLNVIVGENATGKSHLLKLGYTVAYVLYESGKANGDTGDRTLPEPGKSWFQRRIAKKLVGVFKPDTLGRLCRRRVGRARSEITTDFGTAGVLDFSFSSQSKKDVVLESLPVSAPPDAPIFFPAKEVLSLFPGFISLYEQRELSVDETYYDLSKLLNLPLLKGACDTEVASLVRPLAEITGGDVRRYSGGFYLQVPGQGRMEISLVAEGLRKMAMLAYLAANGTLTNKGLLFWDEPEANLHPRIATSVCKTLVDLVGWGVQVILATHSLFVMKELSLLVEQSRKTIPARFFALRSEGRETQMEHGELLEDLRLLRP